MGAKDARMFMEALHKADYSDQEAPLWITVKYRNSQAEYDEWSPVRLDIIKEEGMLDPGFGSGPVSYADIERVAIHSTPRPSGNYVYIAEMVDRYRAKFDMLLKLVSAINGACIYNDSLIFRLEDDKQR